MSYFPTAVLPQCTLALSNGTSNDILPDSYNVRITGPTATFNVTGIAQLGTDGEFIVLINTTAFDMNLMNQDAGSLAGNRINTGSGTDESISSYALLMYDKGGQCWQLISHY